MRFMPEEDAIRALALFDGAMETGKITKKALKTWVVCDVHDTIDLHPLFLVLADHLTRFVSFFFCVCR